MLQITYSPVEVTSEVCLDLLGVALAETDVAWAQWVAAQYAAIPGADALAQAYLQRVPPAEICVAGELTDSDHLTPTVSPMRLDARQLVRPGQPW